MTNTQHSFLFSRHNARLWTSCEDFKPREPLCFSADYLGEVCLRHPVRLIKTVRLRVRQTESLLESLDNLKVVVLVRDPRAVFNSRWRGQVSTWCHNPHCSDPTVSCSDLEDDIRSALKLKAQYPDKVLLLRSDTSSNTQDVQHFLSGMKISASDRWKLPRSFSSF